MARFICRTQPNTEAQGIPSVYLACHDEEAAKLFKPFADELLRLRRCAVYCLEPGSAEVPFKELTEYFDEMRLFVVPVTRKLMQTRNRTALREIPYALEHRIPVLPILTEDGLDKLYIHRFGETRFLHLKNEDGAPTLRAQLEKYLEGVLPDDNELERIGEFFSARMFVGFCKKDRRSAVRLMRKIHDFGFARDVALLRDSSLSPYEEFTPELERMLGQSCAYIPVLTPRFVDEPNYMAHEAYDAARRTKMAIIPVEMTHTDRVTAEEVLFRLPDIININETDILRDRLHECLGSSAGTALKTPEREYYLGLAYLNGVDVEINRERALRLITSAANAGYYDAACRLVAMYRNGDGVRRDEKHSALMQAQAAQLLEEQCRERAEEAKTRRMIDSFRECGTAFYEAKDFANAEKAFIKLYRLCRQYSDKQPAEYLDRELAIALYMLGDIRRSVFDYEQAEHYYDKAVALCKQLIADYRRKTDRAILSLCYDRLGDIARDQLLPDVAQRYYQRALELDSKYSTPRNCAVSMDKLGSIAEQRGNLVEAEEHFKKSLEIRERLVGEKATALALSDLAHSHELLGEIARRSNKPALAGEHYKTSLELRERIANDTESPDAKEKLANCCGMLGDLERQNNDPDSAREYYDRSLALLSELVKDTGIPSAKLALSTALEQRGSLALDEGDAERAQLCFERSLSLCESLLRRAKTEQTIGGLAAALTRMGEVCIARGDYDTAEEHLQRARRMLEEVNSKFTSASARLALGRCYDLIGQIEQRRGFITRAEYYYNKFHSQSRGLDEELQMPDAKLALMDSYERLGSIAYVKNNQSAAWRLYDEAAKIAMELSRSEQSEGSRRLLYRNFQKLRRTQLDLANLYLQMGQDAMHAENYTKAELLFQNAAETAEAIADEYDRSVAAGNSRYELGRAKLASGRADEAVECFMKAAEHRAAAARIHPDAGALFKLSQCCESAAELYVKDRRYDLADRCLVEALELSRRISGEYGEAWAEKNTVNLLEKRGECLRQRGDLNGAITCLVEGVNLRAALTDTSGVADSRRLLCSCYRDAARHFASQQNLQNAQAYCLAAANTYSVLVRELNLPDDRRNLALCHEMLAESYLAQSNYSAARNSFAQALSLRAELFRETGSQQDSQALEETEKALRRLR